MGQILNLSLTAGDTVPLRFDGGSRTVIRVDGGDLRVAYERDLLGNTPNQTGQYFTIKDGEAFVFDPNPITGTTRPELGYRLYGYSTANITIQVWLQGSTQGA